MNGPALPALPGCGYWRGVTENASDAANEAESKYETLGGMCAVPMT